MLFFRKFNNHNLYESYKKLLDETNTPNISLCDLEDEVHFTKKIVPPLINGHKYVEIAGLKWATMNLGAESETDTGLYFQWADTHGYTLDQVGSGEGKKYFGFADYKYLDTLNEEDEYESTFSKYNGNDNLYYLESIDDAATVNWGSTWRIPTYDEYELLVNNVSEEWVTNYKGTGISGALLTDNEDESKQLFFPLTSACSEGEVTTDNWCDYLTSEYSGSGAFRTYMLTNEPELGREYLDYNEYSLGINNGLPIRPVSD